MADKHKINVFGLKFDYRLLIIIPIALTIFAIAVLVNQYLTTGEWFNRSIELRGGTLLTIKTDKEVPVATVEQILGGEFGSISVRGLRGFGEQGVLISLDASADYSRAVERLSAGGINITSYSIENVGSSLSSVFWSQAQVAIIIAFVLMTIITFVVFRNFVPSVAVIASAASDIVVTVGLMQVFGVEFSLASLGALLMLIGYSVDTDIMLTTRLLKESEITGLGEKIKEALKTGLSMTLTSIGAALALLIIPLPQVLVDIASVLLIGLVIDIINTWLMNSVMLRWYLESKGVS